MLFKTFKEIQMKYYLLFKTFNEIGMNELQVILKVECQTAKQMSAEAHYMSPHCKYKYKSTTQIQISI